MPRRTNAANCLSRCRDSHGMRRALVLASTRARTRCGWLIATRIATNPPQDNPRIAARSTPQASSVCTAAAAHSSIVNSWRGAALVPVPNGSTVSVRQPRPVQAAELCAPAGVAVAEQARPQQRHRPVRRSERRELPVIPMMLKS